MKIEEVREIAKRKRIRAERLSKIDLVRAIQKAEGNFDCFGTAEKDCSQKQCFWRDDCLKKNF